MGVGISNSGSPGPAGPQGEQGPAGSTGPAGPLGISGGRLFVPPWYIYASSESAVQLNAAEDGIALVFPAQCAWKLSSLSARIAAVATQGNLNLDLYSVDPDTGKPDAKLADLTTLSSGAAAGTVRATFVGQQFEPHKSYAVVGFGATGADFSVSKNRCRATQGTALPDGCTSWITTDAGATWTAATLDGAPAIWTIGLQTTANHVPQLAFGQWSSDQVLDTADEAQSIAAAGVFTDMSALSVGCYNVYMDTAGAISVSSTAPTWSDGRLVQTGDTTKLYIGQAYALERLTGYQGPIDVIDWRGVSNYFNRLPRIAGKPMPYSRTATTQQTTGVDNTWTKWPFDQTDFRFDFVCESSAKMALNIYDVNVSGYLIVNAGIDGMTPADDFLGATGGGPTSSMVNLTRGYHYCQPICMKLSGYAVSCYLYHLWPAGGDAPLNVSSMGGVLYD